ncbi:hypothetical protein FQN49_007953 [Arthroderma sp. PD_2]|nr:hypothetical protein FQN49_007953 [Arthroderma sp. PD_2]
MSTGKWRLGAVHRLKGRTMIYCRMCHALAGPPRKKGGCKSGLCWLCQGLVEFAEYDIDRPSQRSQACGGPAPKKECKKAKGKRAHRSIDWNRVKPFVARMAKKKPVPGFTKEGHIDMVDSYLRTQRIRGPVVETCCRSWECSPVYLEQRPITIPMALRGDDRDEWNAKWAARCARVADWKKRRSCLKRYQKR